MSTTTTSHRPHPRPLDLDITIISAKHLKNVNWRNGDLNPYVIFYLDPNHRLATKSDDSNSTKPVWNEHFLIPLPSSPAAAILTLEIFHSKPSDTPKPFVGSARVPITDIPNPNPNLNLNLENSTVIKTFDIRRPSGRPDGKIRLKLALRERRLPDYQNTPQPSYYYNTAPHSSYGRFPPSPYNNINNIINNNTSPSLPPPPPPAAPSPSPPPPPPSHTYHYGSYSDPYSGYYQNNYYSQPPVQTPRPPFVDRPLTYGGPSAPVDNGQYEMKVKSGKVESGSVGAISGGLSGLVIDEGLRNEEEKPVGRAERLKSDEDIILPNDTLFPKGHPFPSAKILSLRRSNTFYLEVMYSNEDDLPLGVSPKVGHFTIGPFSNSEKIKVKVRFHLNLHGIVMIESATLIHEGHSINNAHSHSERMVVDNDLPNGGPAKSSPSTTHSGRRQKVTVSENIYGGTTIDELRHAQDTEAFLADHDIQVEQTKERKNTLESFVYDTRNKLLSSYRSFATDEERDGISRNLQETEDWLYDDGDDESEQAYTGRLQDLRKLVDPVESRYKEEDARAQATKSLLNCINKYRMAANSLPATEKEAVHSGCSKAEQWLHEKSQLQASMPKNADPILSSSEINQRAEILERMLKHITRNKYSAQSYDDDIGSDHRDKPDDMYVD